MRIGVKVFHLPLQKDQSLLQIITLKIDFKNYIHIALFCGSSILVLVGGNHPCGFFKALRGVAFWGFWCHLAMKLKTALIQDGMLRRRKKGHKCTLHEAHLVHYCQRHLPTHYRPSALNHFKGQFLFKEKIIFLGTFRYFWSNGMRNHMYHMFYYCQDGIAIFFTMFFESDGFFDLRTSTTE